MAAGLEAALAQRAQPDEAKAPRISWAELGCPKDTGLYRFGTDRQHVQIRVRQIHIIVAEDDPAAVFTVVTVRPPIGPPEHVLGHRVA